MFLFSSIGLRTFVVLASNLVCTAAWSDASAQSAPENPPDLHSGIVGTVVSSETGDPVPFATIRYFPVDAPAGVAGEASSLGDGTFRISAAPGTYRLECSHPSYAMTERTDVEVRAGSYETYDLALSAAAAGVESFEIKARRLDNSPAGMLSKQQRAPAVSDGISADQIRRTTDSNAAEALARVSGMSVLSNGYVFVRGLGERYSQSTINGNPVGSPDPNKRVLPMDLFPASLLDNVVVQKTYTPDQPGDFSGGVVDVRTVTFPTYRRWSFSVAGGRRGTTTGKSFSTYQGGKHDYWGFSDSFREIPPTVTDIAEETKVTPPTVFGGAFSYAQITDMGRSFNKVWSPTTENAAPAHDYSASYGDQVEMFGRPLGFIGSFSLTHGFEQTDFEDIFYNNAAGTDTLDKATDFVGAESKASTLWGAVVSSGYRLADAHKLTLDVLYTRNAEDQVRQYQGDASLDRLARVKRLKYQESGVFVGSAGMNHVFPFLGNAQFDWNVNYSEMENNEPDRREYLYELFDMVDPDTGEPFQQWQLTRRSDSLGFTRLYYGMNDYERGGRGDLTIPFRQWHGLESKVKVGGLVRNKDRGADLRRFAFRRPTSGTLDFSLSPEELLVDANIGGGNDASKFYLYELTRSSDGYSGKHDIQAAYGMVDLPLSQKLRVVTGLRVEDSQLHVITADRFNPSAPPISEGNLDEKDLLPSVNATYAMTEKVNFRAAYSRTVARPDIRELSDLEMPGFVGGPTITGNPDLEQSDIKNYDLRAEWYPGRNQLLAASGFYKDFKSAIEYAITAAPQAAYKPVNADAFLYGTELEARIGLDWLTPSLSAFSINTNVAMIQSEATLNDTTGVQTSNTRPLQGASPYTANVGLFYTSSSLRANASVLYNVFGERLHAVGMYGVPDTYEQPRHTVDATASYSIGGAKLKVSTENLLDEESLFTQEFKGNSFVSRRYKAGRTLSLSLSVASQ